MCSIAKGCISPAKSQSFLKVLGEVDGKCDSYLSLRGANFFHQNNSLS